jgi:6-phosphofructokinase
MIVETMGRYAGWIALEGGIAGGADVILLPELPFDPNVVLQRCLAREAAGANECDGSTIICIAEGALPIGGALTVAHTLADSPDPLRLGGVGDRLRAMLEPHLTSEVRCTLLGHVQRGGTPTAFDRVLATRFGHAAAQLAVRRQYGEMVALQADRCVSVPLADVAGHCRLVPADHALVAAVRGLGTCLGS